MQRIKAVFISHLHGDHYFGLLGLLNSMHLLGRKAPIDIICPSGLKEVIDLQLKLAKSKLNFQIRYIFTDKVARNAVEVYDDGHINVSAFSLKHRIPCKAFVFRQKEKQRTFLPERAKAYGIPVSAIPSIKKGDDFKTEEGRVIPNTILTDDPPKPKSYAYCTDTLPLENTITHVANVDCLYHEATFLDQELDRAEATFHSTAKQAAELAKSAKVSQLLIGHFSARYDNLEVLLDEAKSSFANTTLAVEGIEIKI